MSVDIIKVALPAVIAFIIGITITPMVSHYLYKYRLWKRVPREDHATNPKLSPVFAKIHDADAETKTPRMGGVIIWGSVILTTLIVWGISKVLPSDTSIKLDFLSRNQTWLILFSLAIGSILGLVEDCIEIFARQKKLVHGSPRMLKIFIITSIALVGALWFYFKLDVSSIMIPFGGELALGWLFIPFFMMVVLGTFSSGVIDGLDGLAGGVLASSYAAFSTIAYFQNQIDIAAVSLVITGGIMAFLWFNIPPARFYMGETGMLGLTVTLAVLAFLTKSVLLLPIIALPLVATSLSNIIQIVGRRWFGVGVFKLAPLHHHFQAIGWSACKITMRYWILSVFFAIVGVVIALMA